MNPKKSLSRRELLKAMTALGGAAVASSFLPEKWVKPEVGSGVLPAHAQEIKEPPSTSSQTSNFNGSQQSFEVPGGVGQITVEAWGAWPEPLPFGSGQRVGWARRIQVRRRR
jgi:hypothetical protein